MAAKVEIYTWRFCPFCIRAKALLDRKGVVYTEYAIDGDQGARAAMTALSRAASAVESLARALERRPNSIILGR